MYVCMYVYIRNTLNIPNTLVFLFLHVHVLYIYVYAYECMYDFLHPFSRAATERLVSSSSAEGSYAEAISLVPHTFSILYSNEVFFVHSITNMEYYSVRPNGRTLGKFSQYFFVSLKGI